MRLIQDGFEERAWGMWGLRERGEGRRRNGDEGRERGRSPEPVFYAKLDFIQ